MYSLSYMALSKEKITQLEYKLIEAIKQSDLIFLEDHLQDELLFIAPNGQVITKEIDLMSHQSGQMKVEKIEPYFEDIRIVSDTAIVIVVYKTRGTLLGNQIDGEFRYIRFWKEFNNQIKIIGGSCHQLS